MTCPEIVTVSKWTSNRDFGALPADIQSLFSPQEMQAYQLGASFFRDRIAKVEDPCLQRLLPVLHADLLPTIVVRTVRGHGSEVWFGFTLNAVLRTIWLRAPKEDYKLPGWISDRVRGLYDCSDGITSDYPGGDAFFGVLPAALTKVRDLRTSGLEALPTLLFYSLGNGDFLGVNSAGNGVFVNHESDTIAELDFDEALNPILDELSKPSLLPRKKS